MQTQSPPPQSIAMTMHYHTCSTSKTLIQSAIHDRWLSYLQLDFALLCFVASHAKVCNPVQKSQLQADGRTPCQRPSWGEHQVLCKTKYLWKAFSNASLRPLHSPIMPVAVPSNAAQLHMFTRSRSILHDAPEHYLACAMEADAARHALFRQISCTLVEEDVASLWKQCINYSDWGKPPKKCFYLGQSPKCGWLWCCGPRLL